MKSSPRGAARVRLLAVHTTEGVRRVSDLVAFFNRADAQGSSHAAADSTGTLWGPERGYVPYDRAAWTLRNGNPVSENIEYCGFARTTRDQWLTAEANGLEAIARWLADRSQARGIPLVKRTPAEVAAGASGVIGHHDWTLGMRDGTHWDPGPGFPWDHVITRARQIAAGAGTPEDDLDANQARMLAELHHKVVGAQLDYRNHHGKVVDDLLGHVLSARKAAVAASDQLTPGVANVKTDGQVYAWARDAAARAAGLEAAVRALAEARGDDLDVDALLARVDTTVREAMADTVKVEVSVPAPEGQ